MGQYGPQHHLALGAIMLHASSPLIHTGWASDQPRLVAQHLNLDDLPLLPEPLKWA